MTQSANEGPQPRDILANRRTYLAWVRTALALIGGGVVLGLLKSSDATTAQRIAAILLVVAGAAIAVGGFVEWKQADSSLRASEPLCASWLIPVTTAVVVIAAVLLLETAAFG